MHLSLWKPISHCAAIVLDRKSKKELNETLEEAPEDESFPLSLGIASDPLQQDGKFGRSKSLVRLQTNNEFLLATALVGDRVFSTEDSIPDFHDAYNKFLSVYPKFQSSDRIDQLRSDEYFHLSEIDAKVCLDYCGFGLFSYYQTLECWGSAAFTLKEITANLSNHVLHGVAEEGTAENDIKTKIMDYLNIPENEYGLVFTVSRGSAFRLLAESYPFHINKRLLTMFDHESQSVNWMAQCAKDKGAKVYSAQFKWPSLKVCSGELRKQILNRKKRKRSTAAGLFVFPVQSRVSGAKYSYQWMALAQQNNWHILLDAGSLGPKDMDSLGLSLFRPDFIVTSFYKVFGSDPTGFGCLLIKKSVMRVLQNQCGQTGSGMVRIIPDFAQYLGDSPDGFYELIGVQDGTVNTNEDFAPDKVGGPNLPAFSGVYTLSQVREVFEADIDPDNSSDRDEESTLFEIDDGISVGEIMQSPTLSEDELSDDSYWIDIGRSPCESDNSDQLADKKSASPAPHSWLSSRKNTKKLPLKFASNISSSPLYDDRRENQGLYENPLFSFDAAVLSVGQVTDHIKGIPEDKPFEESEVEGRNFRRYVNKSDGQDVHEELESLNELTVASAMCSSTSNGYRTRTQSYDSKRYSTAQICQRMEGNAITRETEGAFRLLRTREQNNYIGGRLFGIEDNARVTSIDRKLSFRLAGGMKGRLNDCCESGCGDTKSLEDEEHDQLHKWTRKEPGILCHYLDHVNMLGLNTTNLRLRCLINWLVASLLQLRFPSCEKGVEVPLVQIYGPKIKYERGAAVAFNVRRSHRGGLIRPEIVQNMAEKHDISLGIGILSHLRVVDSSREEVGALGPEHAALFRPMSNNRRDRKNVSLRIEVVTASLGFLTNFEDVYKMWAFIAKFLNPSFIEEEGVLNCCA